MPNTLLQPIVALMLLTLAVWIYMYAVRLGYMSKNKISAQSMGTPEGITKLLPEHVNFSSNNLKNLFEVPVIFYALCLLLLLTQRADALYINMAWAYVGLRAVHSAIQCTVNIVILRFTAYFLSSLVLWAMLVRFALQVF